MQKLILFIVLSVSLSCVYADVSAQGKYAGSFKKLMGKKFTDPKHIPGMPGYTFRQGDLISEVNDPFSMTLNVLVKGTSAVVLFCESDSASDTYNVVDVIEIKNIQKGWEVKTAGCQYGDAEGQIIVALVNPGKNEYTTIVSKAWLCEPDRLRFEAIGTKQIKCLNEGDD